MLVEGAHMAGCDVLRATARSGHSWPDLASLVRLLRGSMAGYASLHVGATALDGGGDPDPVGRMVVLETMLQRLPTAP